jgi:NADH:ubiquinone oxidoreductase subunit 5 (subunit L)/multisubunit Na+/H+ antiporter MnhA subunit
MVLAHNVWSGSARAIIVTVIGWLTLIKGLLFLFLPAGVEAELYFNGLHYDRFFYAYILFALALGAYLTYGGFAPSRK